jgi:NAD(P)-dependent dehydrogenase (short-subunit alcohol dehydrogenase family)
MHRGGDADLDVLTAPDAGGRPRAYDTSKLMVTAFAMAMARLRPGTLWHAVDPGWVPTRMGGPSASDDLEEGHRTQAWLAAADEHRVTPRTGGYWHHQRTQRPHTAALDEMFQTELLARLEELTGARLR